MIRRRDTHLQQKFMIFGQNKKFIHSHSPTSFISPKNWEEIYFSFSFFLIVKSAHTFIQRMRIENDDRGREEWRKKNVYKIFFNVYLCVLVVRSCLLRSLSVLLFLLSIPLVIYFLLLNFHNTSQKIFTFHMYYVARANKVLSIFFFYSSSHHLISRPFIEYNM